MSTPPPISVDELLAQAGWVRRLALRLARDAESADDLAQGTMVAALTSPPRGGRPLRPWLARVLKNLARKESRGSLRRERREQEAARPDPSEPPADLLLEELEEQQRLARLVAGLGDPYRRVLLLHFYRGQSAAEIADAQGVPAGTVRSQLSRGLAQLRERLAAEVDGDPDRLRSMLGLAAGLAAPGSLGGLSTPTALAAATTSTTLSTTTSVLLMSSGTKVLAACVTVAAAVTCVLGWRTLGGPEPLMPQLGVHPVEAGVELDPLGAEAPVAVSSAELTRSAAAESRPPDAERSEAGANEDPVEEAVKETTGFYARVVDTDGDPVSGAAFASVDELGVPRNLGDATESGSDGRVHIELPRKAFFTYVGRNVSNTYLSLCAPGHAAQFSVPAAALGSDKDLGDVVLQPGTSVQGIVLDDTGAPVDGALVIGAGAAAAGGEMADAVFVTGPDRKGGRPTTHTASDGRFVLDGMAVGMGQVWAGAPLQRWAVSDQFDLDARVTRDGVSLVLKPLDASALVQGMVEDPMGAPVPGAKVIYLHALMQEEDSVFADGEGRFRITIPEGLTCRMRAYGPGEEFGPSAESTASAGDDQVRIGLTERRVLQLLVVSKKDGTPIERAAIMTMPEQEQSSFLDARWRRTDVNGQVELVVPGEPFRFSVGGTGWEYQKFGPYQPSGAPLELKVELAELPMIRGVVTADGKSMGGVEVSLTEDCSSYRPVSSGFPMRLFDRGTSSVETDDEGRFAIPAQVNVENKSVLLFRKEGFALFEHPLGRVDPAKGLDGVEIELIRGGSLEGSVVVGEGRSPTAVVVAISRGDGFPLYARPGTDGRYSFSHLTPGDWQVDDRDAEPEGRTFSIAQDDDDHPYRWDCQVVAGETTIHDLDLRWQDDLRVEGRVAWNGKPVEGWTADLQAPEHADRAWPPRPVTVDSDGRFSIEARPGAAKLVLRSPEDAGVRMLIERDIVIGPEPELHEFAFASGVVQGQVSEEEQQLRLWHQIDQRTKLELYFESKEDGSFRVPKAPVGQSSLQRASEEMHTGLAGSYMGWRGIETISVQVGDVTKLDLTE